MKLKSRRPLVVAWLAIAVAVMLLFFDIQTALHQHEHYQNELRRSDSRVLAQALKSLLRDFPHVTDNWHEGFVIGSGSGELFCSALREQLPINTISLVLAPYLRVLPQDPDINLTQASLYYVRLRDSQWFVGNCELATKDEVLAQ
jgi:hypothetical protein